MKIGHASSAQSKVVKQVIIFLSKIHVIILNLHAFFCFGLIMYYFPYISNLKDPPIQDEVMWAITRLVEYNK